MKLRSKRTFFVSLVAVAALSGAAFAHGHGHGGHFFFEKADANHDGKLTRDEAHAFGEARFVSADTNKDSVLTQDEMRSAFEHHGKPHAEKKFADKDANHDGKLTKDEVPKMPEEWFKKVDANSDGALTQAEFEQAWAGRHSHHDGKPRGPMAEADADSDGKISKAEAIALGDKMFARMDVNSDGVVTQEELGQGRHGRRHHCDDENHDEKPEQKRHH
jgi:Ca2+-binding EF-hand superfamily protein